MLSNFNSIQVNAEPSLEMVLSSTRSGNAILFFENTRQYDESFLQFIIFDL